MVNLFQQDLLFVEGGLDLSLDPFLFGDVADDAADHEALFNFDGEDHRLDDPALAVGPFDLRIVWAMVEHLAGLEHLTQHRLHLPMEVWRASVGRRDLKLHVP